MSVHPSYYNVIVPHDGLNLLYNSRTGSVSWVNNGIADALSGKPDLPEICESNPSLKKNGYVVDDADEFALIREQYLKHVQTEGDLFLTLLPTIACNFSCEYCFQNIARDGLRMPQAVADGIVEFVRNRLEKVRTLKITWFGGEPLLGVNELLALAKRLADLVDGRPIPITQSIVTNGTLLTEDVARKLHDVGIRVAQISIDSLYSAGKTRRGILNKDGTPSIILKNMLAARSHLQIGIRINVDAKTRSEVPKIKSVLSEHGLHGHVYLAHIHDDNRQHDAKQTDDLSIEDFADLEHSQLLSDPEFVNELIRKLTPKRSFCAATSLRMFVIDAHGSIYKCWHSPGRSQEAIGSVVTDEWNAKKSAVWTEAVPFDHALCRSCKALPLCMGGCVHPRLANGELNPMCDSIRFNMQRNVETLARYIERPAELERS